MRFLTCSGLRMSVNLDAPSSPPDSITRSPAPTNRSKIDWLKLTLLTRSSGISRRRRRPTVPRPARPSVLDTVKIGMLGSLPRFDRGLGTEVGSGFTNVVLDPVLICKGQEPGHALDTDQALKAQILPLATFVTPNHFEAESLSGLDCWTWTPSSRRGPHP